MYWLNHCASKIIKDRGETLCRYIMNIWNLYVAEKTFPHNNQRAFCGIRVRNEIISWFLKFYEPKALYTFLKFLYLVLCKPSMHLQSCRSRFVHSFRHGPARKSLSYDKRSLFDRNITLFFCLHFLPKKAPKENFILILKLTGNISFYRILRRTSLHI